MSNKPLINYRQNQTHMTYWAWERDRSCCRESAICTSGLSIADHLDSIKSYKVYTAIKVCPSCQPILVERINTSQVNLWK